MDSDYKELCEQSEWHFDWFRKEDEDPYFTANCVRFIGDWDPNIKIKDIWEQDTSANKSGASNQYKKLGVDYDNLYDEGHFDKKLNKDYQSLVDAAGLENARILIHNQHPGQMHPLHMDKTYGGGHWDYLGDTKQNVLGRLMIMLDDWHPGQVIMIGTNHYIQWKKGDSFHFRWQDMPHGTCNFCHHMRPVLFITGVITPKFQSYLDAKEKVLVEV